MLLIREKYFGEVDMRVVICTGISGSERREYLREVADYASSKGKELILIDMWEKICEVAEDDVYEATILNLTEDKRMGFLENAFDVTARELRKMRTEEKNSEKCVVVAAHACFHWRSDYLKAFPDRMLSNISPDGFITIIHNIKDIKNNLDTNSSHKFTGTTETDILYWQNREIDETRNWANNLGLKKYYCAVARNEPAETLYKILFEGDRKKIYFSYPMSYSSEREEAQKLIGKLREMGYIVFDPGSIDDIKYVEKLLESKPGEKLYEDLVRNVEDQTVKIDYLLIEQISVGVICEMVHGHQNGKKVYALWLSDKEPSPFFVYHCHNKMFFREENELLDYLKKYE